MPLSKNGNGTDLVLYYNPLSFHSQKVVMALYQKGLKFRPSYIDTNRGRQFTDKFLTLNPTGEVPVLVDDVLVIPDSEHIMNYLEDNFANGFPRLRPMDHDLRSRVEQLNDLVQNLKVDALTFGSVAFEDLDQSPKAPFDNPAYRAELKSIGRNRAKTLENEIIKHPNHADMLRKQLNKVQEEDTLWLDHSKYLDLILSFEKLMDECEAEFQSHGNDDNRWWLCSPEISLADVGFCILLHRLWQLGYDRKMWGNRPFIKRYWARVQQLDSFRQATSMKVGNGLNEIFASPFFWGCLGAVAVAGGGLYWWNKHYGGNSGQFSELPPTVLTTQGISSSYGGPDRISSSYGGGGPSRISSSYGGGGTDRISSSYGGGGPDKFQFTSGVPPTRSYK